MNSRTTALILAAAAFLVSAALYFSGQALDARATRDVNFERLLGDQSIDLLSRIRIQPGGDAQTAMDLVKDEAGAWHVSSPSGPPANMNRVLVLLSRLDSLLGEPRYPAEPGICGRLGLFPEDALRIEIFAGDPEKPRTVLLLGKPGGVKFTVFLLREGDQTVYLANQILYPALGMDPEDRKEAPNVSFWIDLVGWDVPAQEISGAHVRWADGRTLDLAATGERPGIEAPEMSARHFTWRADAAGPWEDTSWKEDQDALGTYVDNLRIVLFSGIAEAGDATGADAGPPDLQVELALRDQGSLSLDVGGIAVETDRSGKAVRHARKRGINFTYLFSDYLFRKMDTGPCAKAAPSDK